MGVVVTTQNGEPITDCVVRMSGWTEEDFLRLIPEGVRADFVRGEVIVRTTVSRDHDWIERFLDRLLAFYVESRGLGKVEGATVRIEPGELARTPDLYFISKERAERGVGKYLQGAPDFVVEVVVDTPLEQALDEKKEEYERAGAREYWVVDVRNRVVHAFRRRGERFEEERVGTGRLVSETVAGFWIDVDWLWSDPLPPVTECLRKILGAGL